MGTEYRILTPAVFHERGEAAGRKSFSSIEDVQNQVNAAAAEGFELEQMTATFSSSVWTRYLVVLVKRETAA